MDLTKIWTKENVNFTKRTLKKLDQDDPHLADIYDLINKEVVNIWLILAYLAKTLKPQRYMELGTRRGFSMAIVGARRKSARLIGFDLWIPGYAGNDNPGPDFVKSELQKVGHTGLVEFIAGDSAQTVPAYDNSILCPLILNDAGHDFDSVYRDAKNCLLHLAPGGYLIIDDLQDGDVKRAWDTVISEIDCWTWQQDRVGIIRNG
jgi:predicted O-methyltransferase YrrM